MGKSIKPSWEVAVQVSRDGERTTSISKLLHSYTISYKRPLPWSIPQKFLRNILNTQFGNLLKEISDIIKPTVGHWTNQGLWHCGWGGFIPLLKPSKVIIITIHSVVFYRLPFIFQWRAFVRFFVQKNSFTCQGVLCTIWLYSLLLPHSKKRPVN